MRPLTPQGSRRRLWGVGLLWSGFCLALMTVTVSAVKGSLGNWAAFRSAGLSRTAQTQLQDVFDRHARDLSEAAQQLAVARPSENSVFRDIAAGVVSANPAFRNLRYFDDAFLLRWWFPFQQGVDPTPQNLKNDYSGLAAARRALETRRPAATSPLENVVRLLAPGYHDGRWVGLLEGQWLTQEIAERFVAPLLSPRFRFMIVDEHRGEDVYTSPGLPDAGPLSGQNTYFTLSVADRIWWVVLIPTVAPPTLAVVVGLLLFEIGVCAAGFILGRKRFL